MAGWKQELENSVVEACFKQVSDGYVVRFNPWPLGLGPSRHFRVNEAQKAEIAERLRLSQKLIWRVVLIWWVFALIPGFGGIIWLAANQYPGILVIPVVIAMVLPWVLLLQICRTVPVRPLLDGLPRSSERITSREVIGKFAARAPLSFLITMLVALTAGFIIELPELIGAVSRGPIPDAIPAVVLALVMAYYGYLIIVRACSNRRQAL